MGTRVLVVDNYDSFVYNLVQELGELGADPVVHRNDAIDIAASGRPRPMPSSSRPGRSARERRHQQGRDRGARRRVPDPRGVPRHQAIGEVYGGEIVAAPTLMHGKTSAIHHDGTGVFTGLPDPFVATRYHSLVVDPDTVPDQLGGHRHDCRRGRSWVSATAAPVEGVQFHPESLLTPKGRRCSPTSWPRSTRGLNAAGHHAPAAVRCCQSVAGADRPWPSW